jgi:hypothetical protein
MKLEPAGCDTSLIDATRAGSVELPDESRGKNFYHFSRGIFALVQIE